MFNANVTFSETEQKATVTTVTTNEHQPQAQPVAAKHPLYMLYLLPIYILFTITMSSKLKEKIFAWFRLWLWP